MTLGDSKDDVFEVAVIGGGVVGCAALRALAVRGVRCVLLEREPDLLEGASKSNSAILHTGFDALPGSIEHRMVRQGYDLYRQIHARMNLPLVACGASLVAWNDNELAILPSLAAKAKANGVHDVSIIGRDALLEREPHLSTTALGALVVPGESIIDPWSAPIAYAEQAVAHGASIRCDCAVLGGERRDGEWRLATARGTIAARVVVNCAGLHGDTVESIAHAPGFAIRPRKGQFLVFDKSAHSLLETILLKVPTPRTKGVLLCRTVFGNLLVGPTAEEQDDRVHAATDGAILSGLRAEGEAMVPDLANHAITACYAGLRPATEHQDYQLAADGETSWITVSGVRSTGLTAALGLAEYVAENAAALLHCKLEMPGADDLDWPSMANLAEGGPRPFSRPHRSNIVCHCEWVTEEEVADAFDRSVPPGTLGGLKRRTRVMMGRCQGFNCMGRVLELAEGRLAGTRTSVAS